MVLVGFESLWLPYPMQRVDFSPILDRLRDEAEGAILDIPFSDDSTAALNLAYQTRHERPIAGGYIHVLFGWEYTFYVTAAAGLLTALLILVLLPESVTPDPHAPRVKSIVKNYLSVVTNRAFIVYGMIAGLALGLVYVFVTGAPFIMISYFGIEVQHYGYYYAVIVAAFFLGSL